MAEAELADCHARLTRLRQAIKSVRAEYTLSLNILQGHVHALAALEVEYKQQTTLCDQLRLHLRFRPLIRIIDDEGIDYADYDKCKARLADYPDSDLVNSFLLNRLSIKKIKS